jgi:hypothetical protein
MDIKNGVVAILNNKGKIIGTGFVAGENLILTCAQEVESVLAASMARAGLKSAFEGGSRKSIHQSKEEQS